MLEVHELSKRYGNQRGVEDISFSMSGGEIVGFLGPNGAGKTTTMRLITGYLHPTKGEIKIDGVSMSGNPRVARRKIGYLPQTPPVYPDMTVFRYMKFIADLWEIPYREQNKRIYDVLDRLGFDERENQVIRSLSQGYKQRLGLAQAIVHNPELLILDEPTSGLDPKQILEARELIRELGRERTVLISTHLIQEVESLCSRILIINNGQLVLDQQKQDIARGAGEAFQVDLAVRGAHREVADCLRAVSGVNDVHGLPGINGDDATMARLRVIAEDDVREALFAALASEQLPLLEMVVVEPSIEEVYIRLTATREEVEDIAE